MIETIIHSVVASLPVLGVAGTLAAVGIAGSALGLFLSPTGALVARYGGIVMLAVLCFGLGLRTASEREAHNRALQAERNKVAALERDLATQKDIATEASRQRNEMAGQKAEVDRKLAEFEETIQKRQANAGSNNSCILTDSDLRRLDGLRHRPRR